MTVMESSHQLEAWRDLYVMLGTSSAALIGLLYVVTSLHLDEIVNNLGYRRHARCNSVYLIMTLVEAALILTPQPTWLLGVELAALNTYGLLIPIRNMTFIYKHRSSAMLGGFAIHRSIVFLFGFLVGIAGGISLAVDAKWGLYLITASYVSLLVFVSLNAWAIMLGVGTAEATVKPGRTNRRKRT